MSTLSFELFFLIFKDKKFMWLRIFVCFILKMSTKWFRHFKKLFLRWGFQMKKHIEIKLFPTGKKWEGGRERRKEGGKEEKGGKGRKKEEKAVTMKGICGAGRGKYYIPNSFSLLIPFIFEWGHLFSLELLPMQAIFRGKGKSWGSPARSVGLTDPLFQAVLLDCRFMQGLERNHSEVQLTGRIGHDFSA